MHGIYVGRVGALAVALGIGTAIMGLSAAAVADTGSDSTTGSAGQESSRSSNAATSRGRTDGRRGVGAPSSTAPAPAAAGRRAAAPRVGQAISATPSTAGGAATGTGQLSAADLIGALLTPGGMQNLVQRALVSLISDMLTAVPADALVTGATVTPEITSVPTADLAAVPAPPVMTAAPGAVSATSSTPATTLGGGSGDAPVATPLAWATVAASRQDPAAATPEVAPAATVTTGAPADVPNPKSPTCITGTCGALDGYRGTIENKIAESLVAVFPQTGPAGTCTTTGCSPYSVANVMAAYSFNVIYSLMGNLSDATVGGAVVALVQQPAVLNFISQTVSASASLANMPPDVKTTIGNAVATFVVNSFGNSSVATQFASVLQSLNLPTNVSQLDGFYIKLKKDGINQAVLNSGIKPISFRAFSASTMQSKLVSFFNNAGVETDLGKAFASSINVLLGQASPTWEGAPQASSIALADYLGQLGANALLGQGNPNASALSTTIGSAVAGLFSSIGGAVADQAGNAFTTFLKQPNVAASLATYMTNGFYQYLIGPDSTDPLPFPSQPLLPALAPAAGVAVTSFVNGVLTNSTVTTGLRQFVNTLVPGMLANPGVDELLGADAATGVTYLLGGSPLAQAIGTQFGVAVQNLVQVPSIQTALTLWANLFFGSILAAPGAVSSLANAAGQLATADFQGTLQTELPLVEAELRANTAIANAVGSSVSSGVVALFGNPTVLAAVNTEAVSLVTALLGDTAVQKALSAQVAADVAKRFGDNPLGQAIGNQVGTALVDLMTNPATQSALVGLVDTMVSDFFSAPGVVTAVAKAAGQVAAAEYAGTQKDVLPVVQAELKANPAIQNAVGVAVGGAVKTLLTDPALLSAINKTASSLVAGLLNDPNVATGLSTAIATQVAKAFGDGPLGPIVGAQVGNAVAGLLSQQAVRDALAGLVDTEVGDFLKAPGVADAFAGAANAYALALMTGTDPQAASEAAIATLRKSTAVQNAVGGIATASVTALLSDTTLWNAVDTAATQLVSGLLSNSQVQQALAAQVAANVSKTFGYSAFGNAVGAQAGAAVVRLLSNPDVGAGLVGVVDTVFKDFFGAPGVVPAFATAAGELATAAVANDLDTVSPVVQAQLKANPAIQSAVQLAVGNAVQTLLTDPKVIVALNHAASSLVTGLLGDPAVQSGLSTSVATEVSKLLGDGALGQAVGAQVGAAVAGLLTQQSVRDALGGLVDTEVGDFFQSPGVVAAIVAATDTFTLDLITTGDSTAATNAAVQSLRASTAIQNAVGSIATASVTAFLNDAPLWTTIDTAAANLVGRLLADTAVQHGVSDRVSAQVSTALGGTAFAQAVGDQVATTVVALMSNPNISAGLVGVVDTVFKDFFGTPGVVTAFGTAAGELGVAAVAGDLPTVRPQVQAQLQANPAIQAGINLAVGDAVTSLLTDNRVLNALDDNLARLASALLGDPDVQSGLDSIISTGVSNLLGNGALGQVVGAQVGTAAVEILSNPIVKDALEGLVDTALGDFFRSPGVVTAFSGAADTFALGVVTGEDVTTALSAAESQLRTNAAVDTAVNSIVTEAVAGVLGDQNVWAAVDGTSRRLVADLLNSSAVQQAVSERVYTNIWVSFNGTPLGQAVGTKVAGAVVSLMQTASIQVALEGLVDSVFSDFFGTPGVVTAFSSAAGELAAAAVAGDLPTVRPVVEAELRANPAVEQATGLAVGDAVSTLLTDDTVLTALDKKAAAVITDLLADPAVQAKLNAEIVANVAKFVGGGTLGQTVGTQVASTVSTFLSNPSVQTALVGLFDDEIGNFFRAPGVAQAFAGAANMFALDVITGVDVKSALAEAETTLRTSAAVDDAVVGGVTESVGALLGNTNVVQAADNGLTTLLTNLGPEAGQLVTVFVTRSLGTSPIAIPVGQALGAAVDQMLAVPGFGPGVVTVIASALPEFLNQFGVPTAVAGVVGDYAAALVAGQSPAVALQNAEAALRSNPTINSALRTTVADSLNLVNIDLLSNPAIQQGLGATTTTLITTLAANQAVQASVAQRNAPLAELLGNAPVAGELASTIGTVITQLLGYPGFNNALLGAVNDFADERLDGATESTAMSSALQMLYATPAYSSAVKSVVPPAMSALVGYPDVRQAAGLYADEETVLALQKAGISSRLLDRTFGQVANTTVQSLLGKPAGVTLADNLAVNLLLGLPLSDWRGFTFQEVVDKPALQIALGVSLGQGVGSLFGDNIFGAIIGAAAAVPATVTVSMGALVIGVFQLLLGRPTYGVSGSAAATQSVHTSLTITVRAAGSRPLVAS